MCSIPKQYNTFWIDTSWGNTELRGGTNYESDDFVAQWFGMGPVSGFRLGVLNVDLSSLKCKVESTISI